MEIILEVIVKQQSVMGFYQPIHRFVQEKDHVIHQIHVLASLDIMEIIVK
jgi:hypothetical protein